MMTIVRWSAFLLIVAAQVSYAQRDTTFAVLVNAGAGYGVNISQAILLPRQSTNHGFSSTIRFLWKPDHRLRVGLETGWLHLTSSEGVVGDSVGVGDLREFELASIPMLVLFSMNFGSVNLNMGAGYYLTLSYLLGRGDGVSSTQLDYGITLSAEYLYPFSRSFGMGIGAGMYGITELGQYVATIHMRMQYRLVEL